MDTYRAEVWYRRFLALSSTLFWLTACLAVPAARPARAEVLRLTQSAGLDQFPRINRSGQVVWEGSDGQHTQIYLWNGGAVQPLTSGNRDNHAPQINDAGQVAWYSDYGDISFWDGASARSIASNADPGSTDLQLNQAGQLAWVGWADMATQVFYWDGAAVRQLSQAAVGVSAPRLNNRGQVAWRGSGAGSPPGTDLAIHLWNGAATRLLTGGGKGNGAPQINDAGEVVWEGTTADGRLQVYLWDGAAIRPLSPLSSIREPLSPQINQTGAVVWGAFDLNGWTLFLWNGGMIRTLERGRGVDLLADLQINDAGQVLWLEDDAQSQRWSIYRWQDDSLQQIVGYDARRFAGWLENSPAQNDAGQTVWSARGEIYRYTPPAPGSLELSPTPVVSSDPSTGVVTLASPAPAGGTVVKLTSSDPAVAAAPPSVTVPAGSTTVSFPVTTQPVPADRDVTLTATTSGNRWKTTLRVWSFTPDSIHLDTNSITGGESLHATVTFHGVAPEAGAVAALTNDHPELTAPTAATVTVEAGGDHADLMIYTQPVAAATPVTFTVSYEGTSRSVSLLLKPLALAGVVIESPHVRGRVSPGPSTEGYVGLEAPARQGDVTVALSNDHPGLVQMPASVTVARGLDSASFPIRVAPVLTPTTVQITASYAGVNRTAALQVDPVTMDHFKLGATVSGGVTADGELVFAGEPPAGTQIAVSTERPDLIVVPAEFTAPSGQTLVEIPIATRPVTATTRARVFVSFNGQRLGAWLTLLPYALRSFTLVREPAPDGVLAVLMLSAPAPPGGALIRVGQVPVIGEARADAFIVPPGAYGVAAPLALVTRDPHRITASFGGAWIEAQWQWSSTDIQPYRITFPQPWVVGGRPVNATLTLDSPAPDGGATLSLSSDSGLIQVPAMVTVPAGQRSITIPVTTSPVNTDALVSISHGIASGYGGQVWLVPPGLVSVGLDTSRVGGGRPVVGTVTLTDPAPAGGTVVTLLSTDPTVVAVPGSVTVPAGVTTASFPVTTTAVAATSLEGIVAAGGERLRVAPLTVMPPSLAAVTVSPSQVHGGEPATGTVTLSGPAPAEGLVFDLQTDSVAYCVLPEQVVVPPGATTATFPVLTDPVDKATPVLIVASRGQEFKWTTLTLLPP